MILSGNVKNFENRLSSFRDFCLQSNLNVIGRFSLVRLLFSGRIRFSCCTFRAICVGIRWVSEGLL